MNVLSLFDGMSCGRIALERGGIAVDNYFASEIDKYAIRVSKANWPDIQHIGDVTKVDVFCLPKIDLLIGGSPCQGFSFAGKQLNFSDPRSKLFFEFVRILKEIRFYNPDVLFFLENVRMRKEYQNVISEALGCYPVLIDSALVSAQHRKRLYWTNIPFYNQPKDKQIFLKDILETDSNAACGAIRGRRLDPDGTRKDYSDIKIKQQLELREDYKTNCLSTVEKDNVVFIGLEDKALTLCAGYRFNPSVKEYEQKRIKQLIRLGNVNPSSRGMNGNGNGNVYATEGKCPTLTTNKGEGIKIGCKQVGLASDISNHGSTGRIYSDEGKSPTLRTMQGGNTQPKVFIGDDIKKPLVMNFTYRKLTPVECERLQTVPDNYTSCVSNSQRYKMLGNGWNVETVLHFFRWLKIINEL